MRFKSSLDYSTALFLGIFFVCLSILSWILLNILAADALQDTFFTNPSFLSSLLGVKYYLVFLTAATLLGFSLVFAIRERGNRLWLENYLNSDYILLEIKLTDVEEYPVTLMENLFEHILINAGEGTWVDRWLKGKVRPIYSFEIVAIDGLVHFYVRVKADSRETVSSGVYAYYPDAEITEVKDYTFGVDYKEEEYDIWGCEWKLSEDETLPIKTYVEFDLASRRDVKDKATTDPLDALFEYGSVLGKGQNLWVQFVLRGQKQKRVKSDNPFDRKFWDEKDLKTEIMDKMKELKEENSGNALLIPDEKRLLDTMSRLTQQGTFEVGMRLVFLSQKENFKGSLIPGVLNSFKLVNSTHNKLVPVGTFIDQDYVWQEGRKKKTKRAWSIFNLYRNRLFFFDPQFDEELQSDFEHTLMSTEVLATVCHFPTSLAKSPSLQRSFSRSSTPPSNLPI